VARAQPQSSVNGVSSQKRFSKGETCPRSTSHRFYVLPAVRVAWGSQRSFTRHSQPCNRRRGTSAVGSLRYHLAGIRDRRSQSRGLASCPDRRRLSKRDLGTQMAHEIVGIEAKTVEFSKHDTDRVRGSCLFYRDSEIRYRGHVPAGYPPARPLASAVMRFLWSAAKENERRSSRIARSTSSSARRNTLTHPVSGRM
jgi:hypothetical protein